MRHIIKINYIFNYHVKVTYNSYKLKKIFNNILMK